ncbi:MAG: small multi-drug export protein [bacterium]
MLQYLLNLLRGMRPEPLVLLVAMLPIAELRGAIPLAISLKVPAARAFTLAVTGNLIPILPVLFFLEPTSNYLKRFSIFDTFFNWLFQRTRNRSKIIEKMELLGLALFVAVPLPFTGAWSGAVAAFLFRFRKRDAFLAIILGVLIAGVVVTLTCLGVVRFCPLFVTKFQ